MSSQAAKVVVFLGALGVATYFIVTKVGKDPNRDAKNRVEAVIKEARSSDAGAKKLDDVFASPDFSLVAHETQQRAGIEVIRIAASRAASDKVDHANRLVRRYQLLPVSVQGDSVLGEVLTTLDGWAGARYGPGSVSHPATFSQLAAAMEGGVRIENRTGGGARVVVHWPLEGATT